MMFGPLAYVEKLAKWEWNVKNLLLAFDCLSSYFCVEPLKTKYATETFLAFKNMIKNKQPQIEGVDDVTEFPWAFKILWDKRGISLWSIFGKESLHFQTEIIGR